MENIEDSNINLLLPTQEFSTMLSDQNIFSYYSANPFADVSSSSPLSSPFLPTSNEDGFSSPAELLPSENSSPSNNDEFDFEQLNFLDPVAQQAFLSAPSLPTEMEHTNTESNENSSDSEQKPKKRGRKRQRRDPNESLDVSAVQISREVLLKISSNEYDEKIKALSRDLTWAEKKEVKKQRRLIKNRESAQASRQRKKQQFDELEGAMHILKKRNEELEKENGQLKTENFKLKEEIAKLYAIIKKTGLQMPANVKKGVVLLAMLFSFGLLFNFANNNNSPFPASIQSSTISTVLNAVPASIAQLAEIPATQRNDATMRHILQEDESPNRQFKEKRAKLVEENKNLQNDQVLQNKARQNDAKRQYGGPLQNKVLQNDKNENLQYGQTRRDVLKSQGYAKQHKIAISEKEENERIQNKRIEFDSQPADASYSNDVMQVDIGTVIEEFTNESVASNLTRLVEERDNETKFYFEQLKVKVRPNTAYFASSDFHQIKPTNQEPFDPNGQLYISVLVPSSSLPNMQLDSVDKFIEINCQVTEINLTPSGQLASPMAVSS